MILRSRHRRASKGSAYASSDNVDTGRPTKGLPMIHQTMSTLPSASFSIYIIQLLFLQVCIHISRWETRQLQVKTIIDMEIVFDNFINKMIPF